MKNDILCYLSLLTIWLSPFPYILNKKVLIEVPWSGYVSIFQSSYLLAVCYHHSCVLDYVSTLTAHLTKIKTTCTLKAAHNHVFNDRLGGQSERTRTSRKSPTE